VRARAPERQGLKYINNDTYLASPDSLLGSILVLRKGESFDEASFELSGFRGFNTKSAPPKYEQAVQSLLVNKSLAAEVTFLSFFKSQLSTSNMLSMVVRDELIQRCVDDDKWSSAFSNWSKDPNHQALLRDTNVVKVLVVRGFVMKSVTYKNYTLSKAHAEGAYGVSVGGSLYSSSDENRLVYLWGLDYGIIYSAKGGQVLGTGRPNDFCFPRNPLKDEDGEIGRILNAVISRQNQIK
jgi:hypothetical protein